MTGSDLVKEAIKAPLVDAGFKKKSDSWYWANKEFILVVNLQKSQYSDQYYLNCAVALKSLGVVDFPKENQCHIRFRLEAVLSDKEKEAFEAALNLENGSLSDQQRKEVISRMVHDFALPILKGCTSKSGLFEAVKGGVFEGSFVHKKIKELL